MNKIALITGAAGGVGRAVAERLAAEVVLRGHPAVREAVVELRGGTPGGDGCLTAYVVFHAGNDCPSSELRSFLARKLPEPNVPSAYVALDQLPLSPTGKLNRSALPEPDRVRPELRPGYIAPRTAFEEIVADIWSELLGVEHPSVHDNFLELGGNSLIATQVISRSFAARVTPNPAVNRTLRIKPRKAGYLERS